jgi:sugar phosphate isomerase/epimerase
VGTRDDGLACSRSRCRGAGREQRRCDGHGDPFWREFCAGLGRAGYHDVLSIEHEDVARDPCEGVRLSVELLRRVVAAPAPA